MLSYDSFAEIAAASDVTSVRDSGGYDIRLSLGKGFLTMRILGRFHALRTFVVLAFAVVAILGVVIWLRASHVESKAASEQPAATPYRIVSMEGAQRPSVLFAGDEFTAGYGGIGTNAYPYIVCDSIGLNCNVDAQTGTGFVNVDRVNSPGTVRLIDRLPTDRMIYAAADVVVVDAGRNDLGTPINEYGEALQHYLREVKRSWPAAKIVVIAPSFLSAEPDTDYGARISIIRQITESYGGVLIDPVAEGWYQGVDLSTLELSDGIHPNQAGHRLIAKKLTELLIDHGIGQPGATN